MSLAENQRRHQVSAPTVIHRPGEPAVVGRAGAEDMSWWSRMERRGAGCHGREERDCRAYWAWLRQAELVIVRLALRAKSSGARAAGQASTLTRRTDPRRSAGLSSSSIFARLPAGAIQETTMPANTTLTPAPRARRRTRSASRPSPEWARARRADNRRGRRRRALLGGRSRTTAVSEPARLWVGPSAVARSTAAGSMPWRQRPCSAPGS